MDPPTPTTLRYFETAEKALDAYLVDFNRFYAEDVAAFRRQVVAAGLELVPEVGALRREE
jgi:hypothetical protein